MVTRGVAVLALFTGAVGGCSLSPVAPSSGGVDGGGGATPACPHAPHALVVADSDYMSTNVSVLSNDGAVLSGSILSSAAMPPGLTAALSGDVDLPLAPAASGDIVLIDRTNAAIAWIDPTTALVKKDVSVATGFSSDPRDYLDVSATKAYVTRYEQNVTPGTQPFDTGSDVLILDTTTGAITGRIDLTDPDDAPLLPRPDRMLAVGGHVWVSLDRLDATFTPPPGDARIAVLNPTDDTRTFNIDLPNLAECGGMALSPSGKVVALACTGALVDTSSAVQSGVVLLDVTGDTPVVQQVFPVAATLGGSVGPTIAFASETLLVGFVYGDTAKGRNDLAYTLDPRGRGGGVRARGRALHTRVWRHVRDGGRAGRRRSVLEAHGRGARGAGDGESGSEGGPPAEVPGRVLSRRVRAGTRRFDPWFLRSEARFVRGQEGFVRAQGRPCRTQARLRRTQAR
jgi:hypothetical protein